MLLCSCNAVSERTIRAAIASGARSPQEIARRCGAGARCGGCWPALYELLRPVGSTAPIGHPAAHGRSTHSAA